MTQRCFNIIDSVKGGSGKSSLSLMLTLAAQKYMQETKHTEGDIRHSLLMDMDMQGSSLDYLLFEGGKDEAANARLNRAPDTLNDAILRYYRRKIPRFISKPEFFFSNAFGDVPSIHEEPTEGEGRPRNSYKIAVALASTKMEDRDCFRAVSRMNYSSQITYDAFGSGLRAVLKESNLKSYLPDELKYVFFDMPPNSNGYSDCVLELLLSGSEGKSAIDSTHFRNYFELMTLDHGHVSATLDWFEQFVTCERYRFPDHFFFVFSNVPPSISKLEYNEETKQFGDERLRAAVDRIQKRLDNIIKLKEEDRSRIYFVGVSYQADYLQRCCSAGSLLTSASKGLSPKMYKHINFLVNAEGSILKGYTNELLNLMCAKD